MSNKSKTQKFHFYAISGTAVWRSEDGENVNSVQSNALIQLDQQNVTQHALGMAQQGVMKSVMAKVGITDSSLFVDIILLGVNYLGHMTEAQFYAVPEGTVRRQVEQAKVEAANDAPAAPAEEAPTVQ